MKKLSSVIIVNCYVTLYIGSATLLVAMERPSYEDHSALSTDFDESKKVFKLMMTAQQDFLAIDSSTINSVSQEFIAKYHRLALHHNKMLSDAIDKLNPTTFTGLKDKFFDDLAITLAYQPSADFLANSIAIATFVQFHKTMKLPITLQQITDLLSPISSTESCAYTSWTKRSLSLHLATLLRKQGNDKNANLLENGILELHNFEQENMETLNRYLTHACAIKLTQSKLEDDSATYSLFLETLEMAPQDIRLSAQELFGKSNVLYNQLLASKPETAQYCEPLLP